MKRDTEEQYGYLCERTVVCVICGKKGFHWLNLYTIQLPLADCRGQFRVLVRKLPLHIDGYCSIVFVDVSIKKLRFPMREKEDIPMKDREDFTQLMYHMATSQTLGLRQALDHLRQDAYVRPIRETLAKYVGKSADDSKGLQTYLVEKLLENSPEGTARDSVDRKVRLWMKDGTQSISKSGAIQVSFALGLSIEEANAFLQRACGEGFHARDPEEIIFLYALKDGRSYKEALALRDEMEKKGLLRCDKSEEEVLRTEIVRQDLESLGDSAGLEEFLRQYQGRLGNFHNTAYEMFRGYLDLLINATIDDGMDAEGRMTVREITDIYLHEKLIPRIQKAAKKNQEAGNLVLSALQRDVQQNWPDETSLSKMWNRKTDISRKALILLFLATDGGVEEEASCEDEEAEDFFEDSYRRMNGMLANCGFAPLDPRCAFDWMVLYCMCVDAEDSLLIDNRIHQFLEEIFPMRKEEEEENG